MERSHIVVECSTYIFPRIGKVHCVRIGGQGNFLKISYSLTDKFINFQLISHSMFISQKFDFHMVHQIMLLHIELKNGYIATHITAMASLLYGTTEYAFSSFSSHLPVSQNVQRRAALQYDSV